MSPNQMAAALTLLGWELRFSPLHRRVYLFHRGHRAIAWGSINGDQAPYWDGIRFEWSASSMQLRDHDECRAWIGQGINEYQLGAAYDLIIAWEQKEQWTHPSVP